MHHLTEWSKIAKGIVSLENLILHTCGPGGRLMTVLGADAIGVNVAPGYQQITLQRSGVCVVVAKWMSHTHYEKINVCVCIKSDAIPPKHRPHIHIPHVCTACGGGGG